MKPHAGARPEVLQYSVHNAGYWVIIHFVNWALEPEPSERTTGTTARAGITIPGLSAWIAASFHILILPVKIFTTFSPERRRLVTRLPLIFRLYMNDVPPATTGMYA
ncbi:unannotated protein [freshwater metagenome]|uniref:Unannotated protein n=1 Tax=freshwater metagenome TaxID=449393 RepID=A0A6J7KQA2_9ZZZZ